MKPTIFTHTIPVFRPISAAVCCLLLLSLAGCSATEETEAGVGALGQPAALSLATIHTNGADSDGPATRVTPTDLPFATSVGFFVQADVPHGYATAINNLEGKYDGTGEKPRNLWLPTDSIWLNNNDADVAIYAPYDAEQTTAGKLKLTAALRLDNTKDLWCKRLKVNNRTQKETPATLTPTLEHVYTRLTITFVKDAEYAAPDKIVSLALAGNDICDAAIYDPFADGEEPVYTPVTPGNGFIATPTESLLIGTDATAANAAKVDLLLIPVKLTKTITLTADVSGAKMPLSIPNTKFGGELLAGKQYQAKVNLKAGKLELSSLEITDWGKTTLDDANLEPDLPPNWIEIGGVKWAKYNSTAKGEFVANPWDYGRYFYHTQAIGKCPANYRLPTKKEGEELLTHFAPAGATIMIRGVEKSVVGAFGVVPNEGTVFGDASPYLFLPAAGYSDNRDGGDTNDAVHYYSGYYWTSTVCPVDKLYCICFFDERSGEVMYDTGGWPFHSQQVRCVQAEL